MPRPTLNTLDAAAHIGLAVPTLEKMRVHGNGPTFLKLGRAVRYRVVDLDDWLFHRRVTNTSQSLSHLESQRG